MKDKLNWKECMKRKCEQCKNYNKCFKEESKTMKKLKFLVNVPDKYTREEYKEGQVKQFNNKRAEEILKARRNNGEPYAVEVVEKKETATKKVEKENTMKE